MTEKLMELPVGMLSEAAKKICHDFEDYLAAMDSVGKQAEILHIDRAQAKVLQSALNGYAKRLNKGLSIRAPIPKLAEMAYRKLPMVVWPQ